MNDANIVFVQETRKFNHKPWQEEFDSNNDATSFLELFAHNHSILFDKIRFSEESFAMLRNKSLNHAKENQRVLSFCEPSNNDNDVATTVNS